MHRRTSIISLAALFTSPFLGTQAFAAQKGIPHNGHTDTSKMTAKNMGGGTIYEQLILDGAIMDTDIAYMIAGILPARTGIGEHTRNDVEEMYFIWNIPAEFTLNGSTSLLPAGASVLCKMGEPRAIYNSSDETLHYLRIAVAKKKGEIDNKISFGPVPTSGSAANTGNDKMVLRKNELESPPRFRYAQFDRSLTKPVERPHDGKGFILNRRPWLDGNFETKWVRIGHCILPPDTSIGYHQHIDMEEVYYIMSGSGLSTVNDVTWTAGAGDALPCTNGDSHGIYNNTADDLDLFVFMVTKERGVLKVNNHGDDLSDRRVTKVK